jgi:molecular chaperone DnaJ
VEGQGEPGQFGGAPGHLRVTVNVRPHPWLRREGLDILGELYVSVDRGGPRRQASRCRP